MLFKAIWLLSIALSPDSESRPICPGDLYSIAMDPTVENPPHPQGGYQIAKVLAVKPPLVFLRLYRNHWKTRPTDVSSQLLTIGKVSDPEGFGVSCIAFYESAFVRDAAPQYLHNEKVTAEEFAAAKEQMRINGALAPADADNKDAACE